MRAAALILSLSTLFFPSVAAAQPTEQPALEQQTNEQLARQYLTIGGAEDLFVDGAIYGFRHGAEASGVRLTANQWQRVEVILREGFRPAADVLVADLQTYIAGSAQRDDLIAALSYYNTPGGQRYVQATIGYSFPLSAYLSSQGRIPLQDAPRERDLDAARLSQARSVATLLINNLHPAERAQIELTTFGLTGIEDFVARSLASSLDVEDLEAAQAWLRSPPSARLEGPSAERTLQMQTASMRAMAAVDMPSLLQRIQVIVREPPPT